MSDAMSIVFLLAVFVLVALDVARWRRQRRERETAEDRAAQIMAETLDRGYRIEKHLREREGKEPPCKP